MQAVFEAVADDARRALAVLEHASLQAKRHLLSPQSLGTRMLK